MLKQLSILFLSLITALTLFPSALMAEEVLIDTSTAAIEADAQADAEETTAYTEFFETTEVSEYAEHEETAETELNDSIDETEEITEETDVSETPFFEETTAEDPESLFDADPIGGVSEISLMEQESVTEAEAQDDSAGKTTTKLQATTSSKNKTASKTTGTAARNGFYKVSGKWKYYVDGKVKKVTGFVKNKDTGDWWYVKNGVFKTATGIVENPAKGQLWYVQDGVFTKATGLAKKVSDKQWYYVQNGIYTKASLLTKKADGTGRAWYYVKKGKLQQKIGKPVLKVKKFGQNSSRLLLTWSKVPGARGYYIYRSNKADSGFKLINITQTACRYLDTGLSSHTRYYYKIKAYIGKPLKGEDKTFITTSEVVVNTTPSYSRAIHYTNTGVARTSSNTLTVTTGTMAAARQVYKELEKGKNFYLYIKYSNPGKVLNILKKKVRKVNDLGIYFETLRSYDGSEGRYYLVDAQTFRVVEDYIHMAYHDRMAEYKIYLDCGKDNAYFYNYKNETTRSKRFIANYRDDLFECEYGTPFKQLSTESQLLFITPGTNMTVRTNYMEFNFSYNVGENAYDILYKMANRSAEGVCRHYALALQKLCDYLGIPCWQPIDYGYNHQWGFVKTTSEAGKTVWYTMDNENVHITPNENALRHERLGEYVTAVKNALGSAYPF